MIPPVEKEKQESGVITFEGFPQGLNTSVPPSMISPVELAECTDWKYNSRGQLQTRDAIVKYTDVACTGEVVDIGHATIDGTERTLISDDDNKVYYLGGAGGISCTLIGTVTGEATFLDYNNVCLVLDGSYVKYMDSVSEIKIAYDSEETFYDNSNGDDDAAVALSAAGVGFVFTTPAWDAGFTIPPVIVTAKVVSPGSGSITATLYDVSDTSVSAVTTYTGDIPTVAAEIDIPFASTDITTELLPSTQYYCLLKGANTDVRVTTVASGGTMITGGSTPVTTQNPIMKLTPGLPPKAKYGVVSDKRPFLWGDTDKPGEVPYGKLSHLEYGYLTTVDESRISFPVGAIQDLYGDLWIYGTEDHPYLSKLVGDTESDWTLPLTFQRSWSLPKTLDNVGNDLFSSAIDGVDSLAGVQEYGDVRSFSESDKIIDKFSNWSSSAFSAYYPKDGQYWLYMPGYANVLVCHTKKPYYIDNRRYYPWTEYTLPVVPTTFKQAGSKFLIGSGNGHLYTFDTSEYKDLTTTQIDPSLASAYIEFPFGNVNLEMVQFIASSNTGSTFNLKLFTNGNRSDDTATYSITIAMSDALTVDEALMDVDDALMLIESDSIPLWQALNMNCFSVQIKITDLKTNGSPVYLNGLFLKYLRTEMIWHS